MTVRCERFCQLYVELGDQGEAYLNAGYKASTKDIASKEAYKLLKKPEVKILIQEIRDKAAEAANVSIAWVLQRFKDISDRCMTAVPVMEFDPVDKTMVQKMTLDENDDPIGVFDFDSSGANKATESIGKHLGFYIKDNEQKKKNIKLRIGYGIKDLDTYNAEDLI